MIINYKLAKRGRGRGKKLVKCRLCGKMKERGIMAFCRCESHKR